jgi:hypothetical protein
MDTSTPHLNPAVIMAFLVPFFLVVTAIVLIPYWVIFRKAGFTPWLSLLMFVPLGNIIMLYVLAFSQWKVVPVSEIPYPGYPPVLPPR